MIVGVCLLAACVGSETRPESRVAHDATSVVLKRWADGYSPRDSYDFTVALSVNGEVTWHGKDSSGRSGTFSAQVSPPEVATLVDNILHSGAFAAASAGKHPLAGGTHTANASITIRFADGSSVAMQHDGYTGGSESPASLTTFVRQLEQVTDRLAWSPP